MSRPEGIPEDVTLAATAWADEALPYLLGEMRDGTDAINWTELSGFFARAIMAEREAQKERDALTLEQRAERHKKSRHQYEAEEDQDDCLRDAIEALAGAAAIRRATP